MRIRLVIFIAIIVAAIVYFASSLRVEMPDEANRQRFAPAYSICVPRHWSAEFSYAKKEDSLAGASHVDGIVMQPDDFVGVPPKLYINHYSSAFDLPTLRSEGWVDSTFQNQPALLLNKTLLLGMSRGVVFERAGQSFELFERLSVAESARKDDWWRFLESFRYPDGQPQPAPAPMAMPATTAAASEPFNFPATEH